MNTQAATSNESPVKRLPVSLGRAVLKGKIIQRRKRGQTWLLLIVSPSADAYSHPSTIEVVCDQPFGQLDEEVNIMVQIEGYPRSYDSEDPDTGRPVKVRTAQNNLRFVELV